MHPAALAGRLLLLTLLLAPGHLSAQAGASPWLPPDHWSRLLLWRSYALGLGTGDPAARARTAAGLAGVLPDSLAARLAVEWAGTLRGEAALRFVVRRGVVGPGGFTPAREWTGAMPRPDRVGPGARLYAAAAPTPWLSATLIAGTGPGDPRLEHATVDLAAGGLALWAGRRFVGYAPGGGGGLVLNGVERLDGVGVRLVRPWRMALAGMLSGEVLAGPVAANGQVQRPWLLVTRAHARPHPRLDIGLTRAALFGGLGGASLGVGQLLEVLVGANPGGDFADDQVASADVRWRPPLGLPLELYGEWAMHDIDFGVLLDMPTFTAGARLPRVDALAGMGVALEHTRVSRSCCGNPPWYQHFELSEGWVADGAALGHPLGGHGKQWRLAVTGQRNAASVVYDAAVLLRRRGDENVYAPERQGRSARLELAADAVLGGRSSAGLELATEWGDGWTTTEGRLIARLRF